MNSRRDLLLFVPRLLGKRRTWRIAFLVSPVVLVGVSGIFLAVILMLLMVALYMAGIALAIASVPLALVAALVFGPRTLGRWAGRAEELAFNLLDAGMDGLDAIVDRLDGLMDWAERIADRA